MTIKLAASVNLLAILFLSVFPPFSSALSGDINENIEFIDLFGNPFGKFHLKQYAARSYPMPSLDPEVFLVREGLADSSCVSFQSRLNSEKFLTADKELSSHPELLTVSVPADNSSATFCLKSDGMLHSHKVYRNGEYGNIEGYEYILGRWATTELAPAYRSDDMLALIVKKLISQDKYDKFIPLKYRKTQDALFFDRYLISPANGGIPHHQKGYLSADSQENTATFHTYDFLSETLANPQNALWFFHRVDDDFTAIQHVNSGKYLVRNGTQISLSSYENTLNRVKYDYHTIKDEALWHISMVTAQQQYIILDKETLSTALTLGIQNGNEYSLSLAPLNRAAPQAGTLHTISDGFIQLKLYPEDIAAQNSMFSHSSGLVMRGVFVTDPFASIYRPGYNFKIFLDDKHSQVKYDFAQQAGSDPLNARWSYDREGREDIPLIELVKSLPALTNLNESEQDAVFSSVVFQLEQAYSYFENGEVNAKNNFTPSILWLTPIENIPASLSQTRIENSGKLLRIVSTTQSDFHESDIKLPSYGFLLKKTDAQGNRSLTIDDPHQVDPD